MPILTILLRGSWPWFGRSRMIVDGGPVDAQAAYPVWALSPQRGRGTGPPVRSGRGQPDGFAPADPALPDVLRSGSVTPGVVPVDLHAEARLVVEMHEAVAGLGAADQQVVRQGVVRRIAVRFHAEAAARQGRDEMRV